MTKTKVRGLRNLERKLRNLQAVALPEVLQNALLAAAQPIRNDAQIRAPVDTTTLRKSIHAEPFERTERRVSVLVGTDVEYAIHQEFGTENMEAQPYLRPAYDTQQQEAVRIFRLAVADQVRQAAK